MSASLSQFPPARDTHPSAGERESSPRLRLASSHPAPLGVSSQSSARDADQSGQHTLAARPIDLPRHHTLTFLPDGAGRASSLTFRPRRALALATSALLASFALSVAVGWLARAEPVQAHDSAPARAAMLALPTLASVVGTPELRAREDISPLPSAPPSTTEGTRLEAAARAERLGIGTVRAAQRLLMGLPAEEWIAAAGDDTPNTLLWPVAEGGYVRGYGSGEGGYHLAVDVSGERGAPVRASAAGIVGYAGNGIRGYGNIVMLIHPGGWVTMYAHNQQNDVISGQRVARGEVIAALGNTGISRGPHVHYEFMHRGRNCDPAPLFRPGVMHRNGNIWEKDGEWEAPYAHDGTVRCSRRRRHPHSRYHDHDHDREAETNDAAEESVELTGSSDLAHATAVAAVDGAVGQAVVEAVGEAISSPVTDDRDDDESR